MRFYSCCSWDFLSPGCWVRPAVWTVPSAACSLNGRSGLSAHTPVETRVPILLQPSIHNTTCFEKKEQIRECRINLKWHPIENQLQVEMDRFHNPIFTCFQKVLFSQGSVFQHMFSHAPISLLTYNPGFHVLSLLHIIKRFTETQSHPI